MVIGIAIGGAMLAFFVYAFISFQKMKNMPVAADNAKIKHLTEQNFNQQIKKGVILVDFWASWCAPCKMMVPILNELADDLNGTKTVGKLNVEQFQSVASKYNVRSIPTMVLFKDGRFIGMKSKEFLQKEINKVS